MTGRGRRFGAQDGQALVLAMVIILVGTLLAVGALTFALNSNGDSVHDERTRAAQQAADAGVQQQLYENSGTNSVGYGSSSVLGVSNLLACTLPELNVNLQVVGTAQASVNSAGVCPTYANSSGAACTTNCTYWNSLDNEDYYESEDFPNSQEVGGGGGTGSGGSSGGSGDAIEFPDILSVGCHTTNTAGMTATAIQAGTDPCSTGAKGNSYSRELDILNPTGPLQAVEAGNDATVNSSVTELTNSLSSLVSCQSVVSLLGINLGYTCTAGGPLSGLGTLLSGLTGTLSQAISTALSDITTSLGIGAGIAVVDGNISAGHNLNVPAITVDAQTSSNLLPTGGLNSLTNPSGLSSVLTNLAGTLAQPSKLFSTFAFGNSACKTPATAGGTPTGCVSTATAPTGVLAVAPTWVKAGGTCTAGNPQSNCVIARPTFSVSSGASPAGAGGCSGTNSGGTLVLPTSTSTSGVTYSGNGSATYCNGVLQVTGDSSGTNTLTFNPGTYVLCGLYADSNVTVQGTSSGAVQVFVLAPGSANCAFTGQTTAQAAKVGNFVACGGVSNVNTAGGLNGVLSLSGVGSVVNPSGFQIYAQGSNVQAKSGVLTANNDTPVTSCPWTTSSSSSSYSPTTSYDPVSQVYIGSSSGTVTQAFIVYAPQSEATVVSGAAFEGSLVGWNVDVTALAILQDLDLGNYPLASVITSDQVAQRVQCDNSIENLAGSESGTSVQSAGSSAVSNSGTAGDLNGCT